MRHPTVQALGLLLTLLLLAPGPLSGLQTPVPVIQVQPRTLTRSASETADSLFDAMEPVASLDVLEARLEWEPDDFEARWRAARAALVLGIMGSDWVTRDTWFRIAVAHGERARQLHPEEPEALSWLVAAVGRRAIESRSGRENARLGGQVWDLTDALLTADPDHALGNDVRGKLHQEVMKLAGWQRFVGRLVLRSDPLKHASWEASEEHLRRAIALEPGFILFYLDLGETYLLQEKNDLARETFEAGLALPSVYPPDDLFKRQIRRALGRL